MCIFFATHSGIFATCILKISGVGHLGLVFQWEDGDKKMTREGKEEKGMAN